MSRGRWIPRPPSLRTIGKNLQTCAPQIVAAAADLRCVPQAVHSSERERGSRQAFSEDSDPHGRSCARVRLSASDPEAGLSTSWSALVRQFLLTVLLVLFRRKAACNATGDPRPLLRFRHQTSVCAHPDLFRASGTGRREAGLLPARFLRLGEVHSSGDARAVPMVGRRPRADGRVHLEDQRVAFCIGAHTATAARAYADEEKVAAVLSDLETVPIEEPLEQHCACWASSHASRR
jgi:hypothetical protein